MPASSGAPRPASRRPRDGARVWPRARLTCVAMVAAAVPAVWMAVVLGDAPVPILVLMVAASVLFWVPVTLGLCRRREPGDALLHALGWGLVSPILCIAGLLLALAPLWIPAIAPSPQRDLNAFSFAPVLVMGYPLAIFPVGAGMGLVAFAISRLGAIVPG